MLPGLDLGVGLGYGLARLLPQSPLDLLGLSVNGGPTCGLTEQGLGLRPRDHDWFTCPHDAAKDRHREVP